MDEEFFRAQYTELPRPEHYRPGPPSAWAHMDISQRKLSQSHLEKFLQHSSNQRNFRLEIMESDLPDLAIGDLGDNDVPSKESAVLVPFIVNNDEILSVVVMTRTMTVSTHKGQVSFPGGMVEADDIDVTDTALRETHEEIGIPREYFTILGVHDATFTRGKHGHITPVIATCSFDALERIELNNDEVAALHVVDIEALLAPNAYMSEVWDFGNLVATVHMYFVHDAKGKPVFIWGATAHIITKLLHCLNHPLLD